MFADDAKRRFGVEPVVTSAMDSAILAWLNTYEGSPAWIDPNNDEIRTINFAKSICSEAARLTTMAIGINLSGSARAEWLQKQIDTTLYPRLRTWVEYGCAGGTVIIKPSGEGIDVVTPDRFLVVGQDSNKRINAVIFQDTYTVGKQHFTKLEYHRFDDSVTVAEDGEPQRVYRISTRTFRSDSESTLGAEVDIESTRWAGIEPEVYLTKESGDHLNGMLFGVFVMPEANNIDLDSPLGMSIFSGAMEELKDLDIAYSRNAWEISNSNTIELVDDALLMSDGSKVGRHKTTLPSHVHNVFGNGVDRFYQQIDRPLKTSERKVGINQLLSFIGYKCGFSNGYFVLDEKTGMITATQVESDDRRTIQLIKDIRDALRTCLDDVIYALSVFADMYSLAPVGAYEVAYDFGDITYSEDEDRARWLTLAQLGVVPWWRYLTKFEGFSEDEARAIQEEQEAKALDTRRLFEGAGEA